jgi:hypothetical protein
MRISGSIVPALSIVAALVSITTLACVDLVEPPAAEGPSFGLAVPGHAAVGSGHVQSPAGLREFTFHALESPSGDASGSYKVVLASGLFFETDVTCLAVDGNTGWVAGTIRATNAAAVVLGSVSTFFAVDNGEGGEAADVVSLAAFNLADGADLAFCDERPLALPQLSVTDGNVQVR